MNTHVCSRGTVRTVPGLCLLSLPIQWRFRECFVEVVLCTEIGIVQTLCMRQLLRRVLRRATRKLMVSGWLSLVRWQIHIGLSCDSVDLDMQLSEPPQCSLLQLEPGETAVNKSLTTITSTDPTDRCSSEVSLSLCTACVVLRLVWQGKRCSD